jgi:hypothetical protein
MKAKIVYQTSRKGAAMRLFAAARASFLCERKEAKESREIIWKLEKPYYICISFNNQNWSATRLKTSRKIMTNESLNQIIQADIDNGTAQYLTLDHIESLKGKRIITKYFGYRGQDGIDSFVVDKAVPAHTLWGNQAPEFHAQKATENPREYHNKIELVGEDDYRTYMRCYTDEGLFWCSDSDRFVQFVIAE